MANKSLPETESHYSLKTSLNVPFSFELEDLEKLATDSRALSVAIIYTNGFIFKLLEKANIQLSKEVLWPESFDFQKNQQNEITKPTKPGMGPIPPLPAHIVFSYKILAEKYPLSPEEKTSLSSIVDEDAPQMQFLNTAPKDVAYYLEHSLPIIMQKPLPLEILRKYPKELLSQRSLSTRHWSTLLEKSMARLKIEEFKSLPFELLRAHSETFQNNSDFFADKEFRDLFLKIKRLEISEEIVEHLIPDHFINFHFNRDNFPLLDEILRIEIKNEYLRYDDFRSAPGFTKLVAPLDFVLTYDNWDLTHVSLELVRKHKTELQNKFEAYLMRKEHVSLARSAHRLFEEGVDKPVNLKKLQTLFDEEFVLKLLRRIEAEDKKIEFDTFEDKNYPDFLFLEAKYALEKCAKEKMSWDKKENKVLEKATIDLLKVVVGKVQEQSKNLASEQLNLSGSEKIKKTMFSLPEINEIIKSLTKEIVEDAAHTQNVFNDLRIEGVIMEAWLELWDKNPTPNLALLALRSIESRRHTEVDIKHPLLVALEKKISFIHSSQWIELLNCAALPENLYRVSSKLSDFENKVKKKSNQQGNIYHSSSMDFGISRGGFSGGYSTSYRKYPADADITNINSSTLAHMSLKTFSKIIENDNTQTYKTLLRLIKNNDLPEEIFSMLCNTASAHMEQQAAFKNRHKNHEEALKIYVAGQKTNILKSEEKIDKLLNIPDAMTRFDLPKEAMNLSMYNNAWVNIEKLNALFSKAFGTSHILTEEENKNTIEEIPAQLDEKAKHLFTLYKNLKDEILFGNGADLVIIENIMRAYEEAQKTNDLRLYEPLIKKTCYTELQYLFGVELHKMPNVFIQDKINTFIQNHNNEEVLGLFDFFSNECPSEYFVSWLKSQNLNDLQSLLLNPACIKLIDYVASNGGDYISLLDNPKLFTNLSEKEKDEVFYNTAKHLLAETEELTVWKTLGPDESVKKALRALILEHYPEKLLTNPQTAIPVEDADDDKSYREELLSKPHMVPFIDKPYLAEDYYKAFKFVKEKYGSIYEFQNQTTLVRLYEHFQSRPEEFIKLLNLLKSETDCYLWASQPENVQMIISYTDNYNATKKYVDFDIVLSEIKRIFEHNASLPEKNEQTEKILANATRLVSTHLFASTNAKILSSSEKNELVSTMTQEQTHKALSTLVEWAPVFINNIQALGTCEDTADYFQSNLATLLPASLLNSSKHEPYGLINHLLVPTKLDKNALHNAKNAYHVRLDAVLNYLSKNEEIEKKSIFIDYVEHIKTLNDQFKYLNKHVCKDEKIVHIRLDTGYLDEKIDTLKTKFALEETLSSPKSSSDSRKKMKI